METKILIILIVLIALGIGGVFVYKNVLQPKAEKEKVSEEKGWIKPAELIPKEPTPQGFSPFSIAITKDGKYAYIGFDLSEDIFKIRLADFTIESASDLSEYFPIENEHIALDDSEKKLFIYSTTWQKLLVLDTQSMSVIHVIDGISLSGMLASQYKPFLITWDSGKKTVKLVNTETFEVTELTDERNGFFWIQESKRNQNEWHVLAFTGPRQWAVGIYDYKAKAWRNVFPFSSQSPNEAIFDFKVLPNEQKAYVATFGAWYPGYHAYGWLHSIDLTNGGVKVVPIDGAAYCLEASSDSKWVYIGTAWPIPNTNNLLVLDTQSDAIVGPIQLGKNKYNWPFTQMNDLQLDPANPNLLYTTNADGNAFTKVDVGNRTLKEVLVFNQEDYQPHFFVRQSKQAAGYILIHKSAEAFELDLNNATIKNVVKFPAIRSDVYVYDVASDDAGRLFIAQGETILEVDAKDMRLLGTHSLPKGTPTVWNFVLSHDQKKLYSMAQERGAEYQDIFLAIDTTNFQVKANFKLEGGGFEKPYELPGGSKLYALGGMPNGPVVIQVISTDNYSIQKTITFDEPNSLGFAGPPNYTYTYNPDSRTLFVGATWVVLAIDTDTDTIKKVIHLTDAAKAIGFGSTPWQLTSLNAVGLLYNPQENYLYIAHLDRSFVSIYNLNNNRFLPQVIPLQGYFPSYIFANDDYSKIYSLNIRSDNVSVIDVKSKVVENVIDLHSYW